jgi:hypothetical protein
VLLVPLLPDSAAVSHLGSQRATAVSGSPSALSNARSLRLQTRAVWPSGLQHWQQESVEAAANNKCRAAGDYDVAVAKHGSPSAGSEPRARSSKQSTVGSYLPSRLARHYRHEGVMAGH